MWICWSYKSVPELSRLPAWRRQALWERCRRKVPELAQLAGVAIAAIAGAIGAAMGLLAAPRPLALLGIIAGLFVGVLIGAIAGEQFVLRRARFYLLAELGEHCPECGYSLARCASGLCPECGSPVVNANSGSIPIDGSCAAPEAGALVEVKDAL